MWAITFTKHSQSAIDCYLCLVQLLYVVILFLFLFLFLIFVHHPERMTSDTHQTHSHLSTGACWVCWGDVGAERPGRKEGRKEAREAAEKRWEQRQTQSSTSTLQKTVVLLRCGARKYACSCFQSAGCMLLAERKGTPLVWEHFTADMLSDNILATWHFHKFTTCPQYVNRKRLKGQIDINTVDRHNSDWMIRLLTAGCVDVAS